MISPPSGLGREAARAAAILVSTESRHDRPEVARRKVRTAAASAPGRSQVHFLFHRALARPVAVAVHELAGDGPIRSAAATACALLASGANVLVHPGGTLEGAPGGGSAAGEIAQRLAAVAAATLAGTTVAGVVATGGDTAAATLEALDARRLVVGREPIRGVAEAVILDGPHAGLRFVAKPGAYGRRDALGIIVKWLQRDRG